MDARKTYLTKIAVAFSLSLVITLLLMTPVKAEWNQADQQDDEPYRIEKFDLQGPGDLDVETSGGHITVKGTSSNTVRVEMYVRKDGRNLLPEDTDLDEWEIDISQSGNSVKAHAERSGGNNWNLWGNNSTSISFVVYTPREMSTELSTSGGHIETRDLNGNQDIATSGGHLTLADIEGTIKARTSGGHINLQNIKGDVEARTSGGHIDVENTEGQLNVRTSGGHISLAEVNGSVEAKTSGGNIKADLRSINQLVELRTSGGNVNIRVPDNIGLDLKLRGSYVNTDLQNFSGNVERDEVEGKLNGGGPLLSARTSGGMVSLSFQ